jgi:cell wall-associated NlpC family hydrolase
LHTFEPVRILAQSGDHQWYWVVSNIATAWIRVEDVAMASDDQWHHYRQVDEPLVVVHTGVVTEPQPYDKAVSNQPIEYGAYLPLYDSDRKWVGNQLQLGHFVVAFPVRNALGQLEVHPALVKNGEAVHQGYLPCSRHELIHSVFALLGDRYAWGDKLGTHDCSSLVMDAYRTLGIQLPRNSRDQARALPLVKQWQASDDFEKRLRDLRAAEPGDLLMMPGHVMMFLGFSGQEPYAIHAFVGYGSNQGGTFHPVLVNAVEVSGLSVPTRRNVPYLGAVTSVVHVF